MVNTVKTCFKCGQDRPLDEFYKHSQMADGHLGKCKFCCRAYTVQYRQDHLQAVRQYDRDHANLPHRRLLRAVISRRWRQADKRRIRAHNAAIRHYPDAPETCQMCGLGKRLERHHPDYGLPLLIMWLCKPCHAIADKQRRQKEQKTS